MNSAAAQGDLMGIMLAAAADVSNSAFAYGKWTAECSAQILWNMSLYLMF